MDITAMLAGATLGDDFPLPRLHPFTPAQAREAGITSYRLRQLIEAGLIRTPLKNVCLATEAGDSVRLRADSLRLVSAPDAVIVDRHAGWLHGAPMVLRPGEHLHLQPVSMFLPAGRGRLRTKLATSGERTFRPDDITVVEGLRVTTPIRTAWDLGRVRWPDAAIAALDAMLRLGRFSHEELLSGIERFRGERWVTVLRAVAPLADARSESPGESVLRLRCHENGLGRVVPQVEVFRDGILLGRLDLAELELMLALEYDGEQWHSSPEQQSHDAERRAEIADEGWLVLALGQREVFGPWRECDRIIREAARDARRRRGDRVVW